MKQIVFTMIFLALLLHSDEPRYAEEWSWTTLTVNYGHILGDEPFPYHPTREEYHKAQLKGAKTSFDVFVLTEEGDALENATVIGCLEGDPFGSGKDNNVFRKQTDEHGMAHVEGKCGGRIYFHVMKDGWYDSGETILQFAHTGNVSLQNGKWQPYGMKHKIVLRPIRNQIRMHSPEGSFFKKIPKAGEPMGLDLFACDWVAPYGKGETADLLLQYDIKENEEEKLETLTFSFPNPGDGIYRRHCFRRSWFREDYNASADSSQYEKQMAFHRKSKFSIVASGWGVGEKEENLVSQNDIGEEDFLVLRTRSQKDENGHMNSCHYSKIVRPIGFAKGILKLKWLTNPTPNDTNLEHDPNNRYTLEKAREEAQRKAEHEQALATVSSIASRFLEALRNGNLEDFKTCYTIRHVEQERHISKWFSKMSPKFASGEMETQIEPKAFVRRTAAIVPVRIWKKGHPEDFEIKPVRLSCHFVEAWSILVNFENIDDRLNRPGVILDDFNYLSPLFDEYRKTLGRNATTPEPIKEKEPKSLQNAVLSKPLAKDKESFVATGEEASAVTMRVKSFILALKNARKDNAVSAYGTVTKEQSDTVDKWLSRAIPFFSSGKVESAVEPIAWMSGDAAIAAIRQWRPDKPEQVEIELTCLVYKEGRWVLLPDFEHPFHAVNGLNEKIQKDFNSIMPLFQQYKRDRKREAAQLLKQ